MEEYLRSSASDLGLGYQDPNNERTGNFHRDQLAGEYFENEKDNFGYGPPQGQQGDARMPETLNSWNSYPKDAGSFASSFQNDLLLDFDPLAQPGQRMSYANPTFSYNNNLDEIISPNGAQGSWIDAVPEAENNDLVAYMNNQNFSPDVRGANMKSIDFAAGDNPFYNPNSAMSPTDAFPRDVRFRDNYLFDGYDGGVDTISSSYLSPPSNLQYMSPSAFDYGMGLPNSSSIDSNALLSSPPTKTRSRQDDVQFSHLPSLASPPPASFNAGGSLSNAIVSNQPQISAKQLNKEDKLKRRREFHNAVERRRRDLIKERIKELGLLVPPSLLTPQSYAVQHLQRNSQLNSKEINDLLASIRVKETKPNKNTILNKTVDYVHHLLYIIEQQEDCRKQLEANIELYKEKLKKNNGDSRSSRNHNLNYANHTEEKN